MSKKSVSERYRPQKFESVIGQEEVIESLKNKTANTLNDMLFIGPAGVGKTTVAHILAKHFDLPIEELNASDDNGIAVVRSIIKDKAMHKRKFIYLLDEADSLTRESQQAMRRIMEKSNAIFILTGNYEYKFLDPILSRCSVYTFKPLTDRDILKQILSICKGEGIEIDMNEETKKGLKELARQAGGDMRKAINILEQVIDKNKSITVKSVRSLIKPNTAKLMINKAIGGDLESAQLLLEKAIKEERLSTSHLIEGFYEAIKEIKDNKIRARLYYKLSTTARACQIKSNPILPLIHLIGFLAYCWILPFLKPECPMIENNEIKEME